MDLDEDETSGEAGISGVEEPEDNDSRIELMIELVDTIGNDHLLRAHVGKG
mgnify:CR=1 FL=1